MNLIRSKNPGVNEFQLKSKIAPALRLVGVHAENSKAILVTFWTDEKPYKCIGSK